MTVMSSILDIVSRSLDTVTKWKGPVMGASYEEKSVWIQLVGLVLGLGAYFVIAGMMLAAGQRAMPAYAALFMVSVPAMVIFLIVGHAAAAIGAKPEGADERDRLISWRAEHRSSWLVATGVLGGVTCMVFGVDNVWTANLLLLSLALSELLSLSLRVVSYRRGV